MQGDFAASYYGVWYDHEVWYDRQNSSKRTIILSDLVTHGVVVVEVVLSVKPR